METQLKSKYVDRAKTGQNELSDLALKQMIIGLEAEYKDRNRESLQRKVSQIRHEIEDDDNSQNVQVERFPSLRHTTIDNIHSPDSIQYTIKNLNYQIERLEDDIQNKISSVQQLMNNNKQLKDILIQQQIMNKKHQVKIDINSKAVDILERLLFE